MDLKVLKSIPGKHKYLALLVAACKAFGLVFSILTVHLVAHLLLEVFSGEPFEIAPAVLKILATVAARVILIKVGTDAQEKLEQSDALVLSFLFFAFAAPVILFIAIYEISTEISWVLLSAAVLFLLISWFMYQRSAAGKRGRSATPAAYILDLGVCIGTVIGILLALSGMTKDRIDVAGAFIVLLHAADFFRPVRQLFLLMFEKKCKDQDEDNTAVSDYEDPAASVVPKKDLILQAAFGALGWMGHILIPLFGCIGMVRAVAGSPVGSCAALMFAAAALYAGAHFLEGRKSTDLSGRENNERKALLIRVFTAAFVCIVLVPVIAGIHPILGVQLLVSYCLLGFCSFCFGTMLRFKEGTAEALTEGVALVLDTLMLVTALSLQAKGAVSSGGMLISVVALVSSVGPFLAIGEREEAVYEEEAETSDSF